MGQAASVSQQRSCKHLCTTECPRNDLTDHRIACGCHVFALLQHLEHRVKAAVARKDEAIQQLQQQLAAALEALRGTEGVLAAQQEELYD